MLREINEKHDKLKEDKRKEEEALGAQFEYVDGAAAGLLFIVVFLSQIFSYICFMTHTHPFSASLKNVTFFLQVSLPA